MQRLRNIIFSYLCILLSGCTDDSYRGMYDFYNAGYQSSQLPVEIILGESMDIIAKGSGVIDSADDFDDRDFYVYAFNKERWTSYKIESRDDQLNTLIDGSVDNDGTVMGRRAGWNKVSDRVVWRDGADVYWPICEGWVYAYDFFAYYLDDMAVSEQDFTRTDTDITVAVEIDGFQDVMSSKAAPSEKGLGNIVMDDKDKNTYIQYYCYSYQSAMMGLKPEFVFNHHLAKIRFCLAPGVTPGKVNKVTLSNVKIESLYKGIFTVASRSAEMGIEFDGGHIKTFELTEEGGEPLKDYEVRTLSQSGSADAVDVGSCFLLAPAEDGYWVHLTMSELRDEGGPEEAQLGEMVYSTYIKMGTKDKPEKFEAGSEYTVTLHVYGREDVRANVEVGEWADGGYVIPDTEPKPILY